MKIFSLQSKTSLVAWSVVLGFVINIILIIFSGGIQTALHKKEFVSCGDLNCVSGFYVDPVLKDYGWPAPYNFDPRLSYYYPPSFSTLANLSFAQSLTIDLIFWVLMALIILSLARYLKNKQNKPTPKIYV